MVIDRAPGTRTRRARARRQESWFRAHPLSPNEGDPEFSRSGTEVGVERGERQVAPMRQLEVGCVVSCEAMRFGEPQRLAPRSTRGLWVESVSG
jgi:hypothetical protein